MTCDDIINELTWQKISVGLSVSRTSVLNARSKGEFPASWYTGLMALCEESDVECPPSLFGMRAVSTASTKMGAS